MHKCHIGPIKYKNLYVNRPCKFIGVALVIGYTYTYASCLHKIIYTCFVFYFAVH